MYTLMYIHMHEHVWYMHAYILLYTCVYVTHVHIHANTYTCTCSYKVAVFNAPFWDKSFIIFSRSLIIISIYAILVWFWKSVEEGWHTHLLTYIYTYTYNNWIIHFCTQEIYILQIIWTCTSPHCKFTQM